MGFIKTKLRRFWLSGDYLSRGVAWAVDVVPYFYEPPIILFYTALIFLLAVPQRRAVQSNLRAIFPEAGAARIFFRAFRVFWNFAWTFVDATRCRNHRAVFDWEFVGDEFFDEFTRSDEGAILLTAHTGNYDLAASLFADRMNRRINTVRATERTEELQQYSEQQRKKLLSDNYTIAYNKPESMLGLELLNALNRKESVAIQGDRAPAGVSVVAAQMFGRAVRLPKGPFVLAAAARCKIYPVFVVRLGRRRYRTIVLPAIEHKPASREETRQMTEPLKQWSAILESILREYWYCWFAFESAFDSKTK